MYDEVVTLTQRRTGTATGGIAVDRRIRGKGYPDVNELLSSSTPRFAKTAEVSETDTDPEHDSTDNDGSCHRIDAVVSFDNDFDALIDRLAPDSIDVFSNQSHE